MGKTAYRAINILSFLILLFSLLCLAFGADISLGFIRIGLVLTAVCFGISAALTARPAWDPHY